MVTKLNIPEGSVFGDWTVIMEVAKKDKWHRRFLCRCVCGVERTVDLGHLRSGRSSGCGCSADRRTSERSLKHGLSAAIQAGVGSDRVNIYRIWLSARDRVFNKRCKNYPQYGGRGIKMAPEWDSFEEFERFMGPRPTRKHSLDRIDNDGDYAPGNVKWSTQREQCLNQRRTILLTYKEETKPLRVWVELYQVNYSTAYHRLKRGCSAEEILGLVAIKGADNGKSISNT